MSSEGPTTVGSINARLTLNADDFERGMDHAAEQADRLDGRDVTVDVHADTAAAVAGIDRVQLAADRLRLAQMRLDEVNSRARATDRDRLSAQIGLATAQDRLARATARQAEATDSETESTNRNTEAKKGQFSAMQLLLAASPLLLAGTTELAAATVGLGVAFVGMGAAGALAIKGIKDQMEQGTVAGNTYATGLSTLKADLDQLAGTAATQMLFGFSSAVQTINQHMPFLNQFTGEMAAQLGRIGSGLLSNVLMGLERMAPLIEASAVQLGDFIGWLGHFTTENGFSQFVAYAVATLPQVMGFLRDVVTLAGRLIGAFAPLGPTVIGALDLLVNVLNSLPLPGLAAFVGIVMTLGPAFQIAKTAVALFGSTAAVSAMQVTVFGTAINLAVPIVGVLIAALAGLSLGFAASATAQQQAIPTAMEYADAIRRDGDAVGHFTAQIVAKNLAESGAYDAAQRLGISQEQLTSAVLNGGPAFDAMKSKLANIKDETNRLTGAHGVSTQAIREQRDALQLVTSQMEGNRNAITGEIHSQEQQAAAVAGSAQAARDKAAADYQGAAALGITVKAYQDATAAQDAAAGKTRETTLAMQLQNDAAGILKGTLDALNGKALSAAQAQNAFDSQLANMGTHVDSVGKQIIFTTDSIGNMSAASVALRGQLNGQVAALESVVEANGGLSNSTGAAREQMETMRQQIIDNAVAHGVDRDAVTAYIDKILQIPASVPPTKIDADTAQAEAALARVRAGIDSLYDKTVTITTVNTGGGENAPGTSGGGSVHANATGGWAGTGPAYFADGGSASRYARGTDTIPTMLSPGEFTVRAPAASKLPQGALEYINRTGQLPQQGGMGPVHLTAVFENPFTGEQVRATVRAVAQQEIGNAVRDAAYLRPGVG